MFVFIYKWLKKWRFSQDAMDLLPDGLANALEGKGGIREAIGGGTVPTGTKTKNASLFCDAI